MQQVGHRRRAGDDHAPTFESALVGLDQHLIWIGLIDPQDRRAEMYRGAQLPGHACRQLADAALDAIGDAAVMQGIEPAAGSVSCTSVGSVSGLASGMLLSCWYTGVLLFSCPVAIS